MVLSVPMPSKTVGLRAGNELWVDRVALAAAGITVNTDCNGSTNLVYTPAVVPVLAGGTWVTYTWTYTGSVAGDVYLTTTVSGVDEN